MSFISQLINRFSTGSKPDAVSVGMDELQRELQALKEVFAILSLQQEEHAAKTSKNLESYRARSQPRKEGKFAPQEPAQPSRDGGLIEAPTHDEIEHMARSTGLIR